MKYKFIKTVSFAIFIFISSAFLGYKYGFRESECYPIKDSAVINKPILTVAGIVYVEPEEKYALIQRGKDPVGIAMFGGHIESEESPESALIREAKEELNVEINDLRLIGLHGDFGRDPRQHSVEGTYFCTTSQIPLAGSDAKKVMLYSSEEIINLIEATEVIFAFDHRQILKNFFQKTK